MEPEAGIWQVGMLLEASYLPRLKKDPMKLIVPKAGRSGRSGVASVCKIGTLNTFKFANEYVNPTSNSCTLRVVDHTDCQYPSVLSVPLLEDNDIDSLSVLNHLNLTPNDLHIVTGLPQKSQPVLLLASQHFMESYGFFTREQVWFRWSSCIPLKEVLVKVINSSAVEVAHIATQLYHQDMVVLHKGFNYTIPMHPNEPGDQVCRVHVCHCSPVLQGRITKDTVITVLPPSPSEYSYTNKRRRSLRDISKRVPQSDMPKDESTECVIEAVCVSSYKLPSHYIVLPKEIARKHNITHCQNVWVEAQQAEDRHITKLSEVNLQLRSVSSIGLAQRKHQHRQHMAIVFLYEVEYELEQYVSPFLLGSEYDTVAMTMAYIHPELLFYLFPETLSTSRCFTIKIQVRKRIQWMGFI